MTERPNRKTRSDKKYFTDEERKAANREKAKRHYDKNPKRANALWLAYSRSIKGRAQALRSGAQQRAKKKNQPMELDNEWLIMRLEHGHCEVTGLPFVLDSPQDCAIHPFTPSVDKIVPALGYTKENCRMVVFAVNAAKQDWTDDTLLAIAAAIHSNKSNITGKFRKMNTVFQILSDLYEIQGQATISEILAATRGLKTDHDHEILGDHVLGVLAMNKQYIISEPGLAFKGFRIPKTVKTYPSYDGDGNPYTPGGDITLLSQICAAMGTHTSWNDEIKNGKPVHVLPVGEDVLEKAGYFNRAKAVRVAEVHWRE